MFLNIDRNTATASFFITLTEKSTFDNPVYVIQLDSDTTNKTYTFNLGSDVSSFPDRYNRFDLSVATFSSIEDGLYNYSITENIYTPTQSNIVEVGMLKVLPLFNPESEYIYHTPNATDDDYVVYKPQ